MGPSRAPFFRVLYRVLGGAGLSLPTSFGIGFWMYQFMVFRGRRRLLAVVVASLEGFGEAMDASRSPRMPWGFRCSQKPAKPQNQSSKLKYIRNPPPKKIVLVIIFGPYIRLIIRPCTPRPTVRDLSQSLSKAQGQCTLKLQAP